MEIPFHGFPVNYTDPRCVCKYRHPSTLKRYSLKFRRGWGLLLFTDSTLQGETQPRARTPSLPQMWTCSHGTDRRDLGIWSGFPVSSAKKGNLYVVWILRCTCTYGYNTFRDYLPFVINGRPSFLCRYSSSRHSPTWFKSFQKK